MPRRRGWGVPLRERIAAGLTWTGAVHWIGVVAATVTTAVLARLLVPADFAVVAAAGAVGGIAGVLQESGLAAAVVQHRGDVARAATTALVLNVAAATAATLLCVVASPWLAAFFQIDQAGALAAAFAPLWLRGWTNVPVAHLQRRLAFGRAAAVEGVQVVAYPAMALPLAFAGWGAWALVLGQVAAALAAVVAAWALVGWRPRRRDLDWQTGRALAGYGRPIVGSNLLGMVNDRVDNWVVGHFFGAAALGLYAMAFRLSTLPRTGFSFVVSRVLFPAMAGLQDDARRFRAAYLRGLHWVAIFAVPASVGLALVAPELVQVVLGPRWSGTVTPLRILAAFGLLASLSSTTGDVFKAAGRSRLVFDVGLVHSLVLWSGLAFLGRLGLTWVAVAVTLAALASCLTAFACVLGILQVGPGALWRAVRVPVLATAVLTAVVLAVAHVLPPGAVVGLGGMTLAGAAGYAAALALLAPEDVREVASALAALRVQAAARRGGGAPVAWGGPVR